LERGDIVVGVNGREVRDPEGLRFRLATLPIGDTAALTVHRRGLAMEVDFLLVAPPEQPPREETRLEGRHALTGATVANLSPAVAEEMGISGIWEGVVITAVKRGSFARRAGFEPGDVLLRLNGADIRDVAELVKAIGEAEDRWEVGLRRGGEVITLVLG
jgi:serine protease Do